MLDVRKSPEVQAAILTMRRLDSELRRDIYAESRSQLGGAWLPALQARAERPLEQRIILKGAHVKVGTDGFTLLAATSRKALRNGLVPADSWPGGEFGARTRRLTYERRSTLGKVTQVTRMINRQFRPRVPDGRIAYDAASQIGTKLVGVWVRLIVDKVRTAARAEE
jgi:hypothetical protein